MEAADGKGCWSRKQEPRPGMMRARHQPHGRGNPRHTAALGEVKAGKSEAPSPCRVEAGSQGMATRWAGPGGGEPRA